MLANNRAPRVVDPPCSTEGPPHEAFSPDQWLVLLLAFLLGLFLKRRRLAPEMEAALSRGMARAE